MKRIRIKDIAELANVSIGTVDRVIHNRGEVSQATRERIQELLRETNYTPDINASSLALKREIRLAVVMPGPASDHAFWSLPGEGVEKAVEMLSHYSITVERVAFDQFSREDFERRVREFPFQQVHGVLFAPVFREESLSFLRKLEQKKIPVVLFNSYLEDPAVSGFVGQDASRSGTVAAKLISYGMEPLKEVAVINMSDRKHQYPHIINREKGFRSYFETHTGKISHLTTVDVNAADGRAVEENLDRIFERQQITGIFVTSSRVYRVASYLEGRGLMNIRLVGYDLLPENVGFLEREYIDFLISQRPEQQSYRGLTALFNLVAFSKQPRQQEMMPIDIITRENLEYYNHSANHT